MTLREQADDERHARQIDEAHIRAEQRYKPIGYYIGLSDMMDKAMGLTKEIKNEDNTSGE